jgi:hypothetical protein
LVKLKRKKKNGTSYKEEEGKGVKSNELPLEQQG